MLTYFYQIFFLKIIFIHIIFTSFSPFSLPLYYLFFFPRLLQILPFFFFSFLSPLPLSFTLFSYPLQLSTPPLQFTSLFHFLQFSPLFILSLHYSSFFLLLFSSPLLYIPLLLTSYLFPPALLFSPFHLSSLRSLFGHPFLFLLSSLLSSPHPSLLTLFFSSLLSSSHPSLLTLFFSPFLLSSIHSHYLLLSFPPVISSSLPSPFFFARSLLSFLSLSYQSIMSAPTVGLKYGLETPPICSINITR